MKDSFTTWRNEPVAGDPQPKIDSSRYGATELSREMTLFHAVMIGVGAMIGAGIFVLTGTAAGLAGPALILAFAANGLIALLTASTYAELGSTFPAAGGGYQWVKEGLPEPNGFLSGWTSWFAQAVACSLYALAFGAFATEIIVLTGLPGWMGISLEHGTLACSISMKAFAVLAGLLFMTINYRGAGETGFVEALVTIAKIIVIVLFLVFGTIAFFRASPESIQRFADFMPMGISGVLVAMGFTFIAFEGYEIIAQCGEELKDPMRNIPRSIFISMAVVVPIYVLVAAVAIGAVTVSGQTSWAYLGEHGEMAMIRAADDFMFVKGLGAAIFLVGGIFSTMSALNATIYSSSRIAFAMGRDRNIPPLFGRVHPTRQTPTPALFASTAFILFMALVLPLKQVASATSVMFLILFMFVNLALINLRRHRPEVKRGFRVPFVPWLPLAAVAANGVIAVFLFSRFPTAIPIIGGYILLGLVVYFLYARPQEFKGYSLKTIYEQQKEAPERAPLLVPIANPASHSGLVNLAQVLAREGGADILSVNAVPLPMQTPLSYGRAVAEEARKILAQAARVRFPEAAAERMGPQEAKPRHGGIVKVCHHVHTAIQETVREKGARMVILGWRGKARRRDYIFGNTLDDIVMNAPCDVVMLSRPDLPLLERKERILAPFVSAHNSVLSFRIAMALARATGALPVFMHMFPPEHPGDDDALEAQLATEVKRALRTEEAGFSVKAVRGVNPAGAILLEKGPDDLLVLGASREGILRRALFGDIPESVVGMVDEPVILVKPYPGHVKSWIQQFLGSRRSGGPKGASENPTTGCESRG
jgi:amino acid transporter/nucleotide-binding universal stress UspA family protein